jgi:protein-S-isoprenylcysteine O-methyltransferase Ste14
MLWLRGLIFTLVIPCVVVGVIPAILYRGSHLGGGLWQAGWVIVLLGAAIYVMCLLRFMASGGTPMGFFAPRAVKAIFGDEPQVLVERGLYRFSRNPMYVGVLTTIFGQAILFASLKVAIYGIVVAICFHLTVVFLEEPHLRRERGPAYEEFCRRVPRWIGRPR